MTNEIREKREKRLGIAIFDLGGNASVEFPVMLKEPEAIEESRAAKKRCLADSGAEWQYVYPGEILHPAKLGSG